MNELHRSALGGDVARRGGGGGAAARARRGRALDAGSRRVPAAAARVPPRRRARAPAPAAAQQVPPQDGQRARAQPHARDQPRLRGAAPRRARRALPAGAAPALREAHQDHHAAPGHALHRGAGGRAAGARGGAVPGALALAALLRAVGDAVRVRGGLPVALRLVLRGVRLRVRGDGQVVRVTAGAGSMSGRTVREERRAPLFSFCHINYIN